MEEQLISLLREALGGSRKSPEGIGDDAAVLRASDGRVVAMDTVVEGTHFDLRWSSIGDVAYKVFASNVSDIWAMGARPSAWLLSLGIPRVIANAESAHALVAGFVDAVSSFAPQIHLVGGDTVRAPFLTLTVTMFGAVEHPLTRHTGRVGDSLWVNGPLGWSRAGLRLLSDDATVASGRFVDLHRRPRPSPIDLSAAEEAGCSAAMDVSDGLAVDLRRLCQASGCGAELRLPLPGRDELLSLGFVSPKTVDEFQLRGGEDFVALLAAPRCPGPGFTKVGTICEPHLGLTAIGADGSRLCLPEAGFEHFS